jgi:hypothetical protein
MELNDIPHPLLMLAGGVATLLMYLLLGRWFKNEKKKE